MLWFCPGCSLSVRPSERSALSSRKEGGKEGQTQDPTVRMDPGFAKAETLTIFGVNFK